MTNRLNSFLRRFPARLLLAACVLVGSVSGASPDETAGGAAFSVRSPFTSYTKSRKFFDRAALEVAVKLDYSDDVSAEAGGRLVGKPGVTALRSFSKTIDKKRRTVDLALLPVASGGWEILVDGRSDSETGAVANPDLPAVEQKVRALVDGGEASPAGAKADLADSKKATIVITLSYTQTDRIIAILKALGYPTIEFTREDGESSYDRQFTPVKKGEGKLPTIIKLIDAPKTSLMDPFGDLKKAAGAESNSLGGTFLHQITSGEPQQRLLIVYDEQEPEAMFELVNLIREKLDRPARQIVIEALVIELNSDTARDLGVSFSGKKNHLSGEAFTPILDADGNETGALNPFAFTFDNGVFESILNFKATLKALIEKGDAEVLSRPSILVLDGRQARIQVGQQVPVVNSTTQLGATTSSVEYITVGIVLNLRPRISDDASEVTMQVETIVSAVNQAATNTTGTQLFIAPTVDNRQVQTFVRVSDDTPFIVGGLVSRSKQVTESGIPILSSLPIIGKLFGQDSRKETKREVIVVITPHVIPAEGQDFSYVTPKDADRFDSFGNQLFQSAYRIRSADVLDFGYVNESKLLRDLVAKIEEESRARPALRTTSPFRELLDGAVPAEEILVRRMIWEIVLKTGYQKFVNSDRIGFFEERYDEDGEPATEWRDLRDYLAKRTGQVNTFDLTFDARSTSSLKRPFARETGTPSFEAITRQTFLTRLREENKPLKDGSPSQWSMILPDPANSPAQMDALEALRAVFVLNRILELNATLPLRIKEFHPGRQIVFPTEEDLQNRFHVIDKDIARMFYQVMDYYPAFSSSFSREFQEILKKLEHAQ